MLDEFGCDDGFVLVRAALTNDEILDNLEIVYNSRSNGLPGWETPLALLLEELGALFGSGAAGGIPKELLPELAARIRGPFAPKGGSLRGAAAIRATQWRKHMEASRPARPFTFAEARTLIPEDVEMGVGPAPRRPRRRNRNVRRVSPNRPTRRATH